MRLFISIDLDENSRKGIAKLLKKLDKKHWQVRWELVEKLHITLVFLGDIDKQKNFIVKLQSLNCKAQSDKSKIKIEKIKECIRQSSKKIKPFSVSFKGLGCFPDYTWPRVVWLGLKGELQTLAKLQKQLYKELIKAGIQLEKRPFSAHITLGRIKAGTAQKHRLEIGRQLKAMRELDFKNQWLVNKVILYESQLSFKGSVYLKQLETWLE